MKKIIITILALVTASVGNMQAQQQSPSQATDFLVADGSTSGTYQQFLKELIPVFSDAGVPLTFKEVPSTGAVDNLDKLINNQVMGAF